MKLFTRKRPLKPDAPAAPTVPAWQIQTYRQGIPNPSRPELLAEMQRDSMIQTALTVKQLGVLSAEWEVVGDSDAARFVREAFERMEGSVITLLQNAMDAFIHGWSIQEIVYTAEGGKWWIQSVKPKNPRYFSMAIDEYETPTALVLNLPGEAERRFSPDRFVIFRHRGGYGRPYGVSDLDAALPHFQSKRELMAAWKIHLAKFASPTLMAKFGKDANSEDQSSMLRALESIERSTAIVFPEEFDVRALNENSAASQGFMEAINFHNREIARAILGQTLTTSEGERVGSLAMGRVHLQVLLLQLEALRRDLADTVVNEQVIKPLVALNFGNVPLPKFRFKPTQLSAFATGQV